MNESSHCLRDIETLMKVKKINNLIMAKVLESKALFQEDIESYYKDAIKLIPFPKKDSREYPFTLKCSITNGILQWKSTITDKKVHIPWETILPFDLIEKITSFPVNSGETYQVKNIQYKGNILNVSFIKYLDDAIVGIIQKIKEDTNTGTDRDVNTIDVSQYMELPEEEQCDIFTRYFNAYPGIKRKVLFDFFTNILPNSDILKEIT